MMSKNRIEQISNILIIIVACVLLMGLAKREFGHKDSPASGSCWKESSAHR